MASNPDTQSNETLATRVRGTIPKWVGIGLFVYLTVFALGYAQVFFVPVVLAYLLSMIFGPVRRFFDRRGMSQGLSAFAIVLALIFGFLGIAAALAVPAAGWVNNAPQIEHQVQDRLSGISGPFSGIFEAQKKLRSMTEPSDSDVQQVETQGTGLTTRIAAYVPTFIAQFVFTMVLLIFLLASGDMFYEKIVHTMPTFRDKKRAARIAHDIERKLSRYLLTITIINASLGVVVGLAMWALGMPSPLVFGVIAFIFNFVPYLGAFVGILIAAVVALISFQWLGWPLIVAAVYLTLTTLEGQLVTPYFVGRSLRLNAVVVFVTISFWAWLWSAIGMIVAVPLLVAAKTFGEHIEGMEPLSDFLAERHGEQEDETETAADSGRG